MNDRQGAAFDLKSYAGAGDLKISVRITWRQLAQDDSAYCDAKCAGKFVECI